MKKWVYICFFIMVGIGFIAGLCQELKKGKGKRMTKPGTGWFVLGGGWFSTVVVTLAAVMLVPIVILYGIRLALMPIMLIPKTYSVEIDGKDYVAYVSGFRRASVDYYEDINFFFRGNQSLIYEVYDVPDPFQGISSPDYEKPEPRRRHVYDKEGNLIESRSPEKPDDEARKTQAEVDAARTKTEGRGDDNRSRRD